MAVFLYFVLLMKTVTCQFPPHIDLQKVGEISYNSENYKILKPTVHKITDHFKDFMLRRDTGTEDRVFVDEDGFRHIWSGFGKKSSNLRKNNGKSETDKHKPVQKDDIMNLAENENDSVETKAKKAKKRKHNLKMNALRQAIAKKTTASPTTSKHVKEVERTVAKTYFFCPFIGVIAMNAYIDD